MSMVALPFGSTLMGEALLILLIGIVLLIVFRLGKFILKLVFGIITNSILGIVSMFLLNSVFGLGIPIGAATLLSAALFGLPAVGTFVILRFFGVPIVP